MPAAEMDLPQGAGFASMRKGFPMRSRAPAALFAAILTLVLAPAAATAAPAEEYWTPYWTTIDEYGASELAKAGVDVEHTGYDHSKSYPQRVDVELLPSQAQQLEKRGLELEEVELRTLTASALTDSGGDSPNEYYDVYRMYSEPGGIYDEMRELAAEHRDIVKPVIIGTSLLGKPIIALKITKDARNAPDNSRPAILYSSVNHAREWIAAEVARRLRTTSSTTRTTRASAS